MNGRYIVQYLEKNLPLCDYVHHNFHMVCSGAEPRPLQCEAGNKPPELGHGSNNYNYWGKI